MSDTTPNLRARSVHLPGDPAMWVMVLGDMMIFAGYFAIFIVHRAMNPQQFLAEQNHLDVTLGTVNTLILLTSSYLVARVVTAARSGQHRQAIRLLWAAGGCGALFATVKTIEWAEKLSAGHTVSSEFFAFYYVLTGVHLLHVLIGLIVLGVCIRELSAPLRRRLTLIEQGATYWHMVDLLWVVIFGLFYVMR